MKFLVRPSYSQHLSSTAMAMSSSFCPQLPCQFGTRPIFYSPAKSPFTLSFKAFASQASIASSGKEDLRVGFLGLGIMGAPMAQNLIKSGCDVTVWNRTRSKCDPLINLGAKKWQHLVISHLQCLLILRVQYVDVSTVDDATSKLISARIKDTGALFLEAPVSGSKKPAEDGQLIFLTAGDKSLYETVAPFLDIMGKSRFYLGDVGNGAAMKLVVNMIMGSMMAAFSEGMLLSEKVGLDPSVLIEVVSQGAISAPMYSTKGPSMIKSYYPTAFPLKHQQKDLRLALGLAESVSQSTPIAAAANELYKVAKSHGLSDQDFSAVIEALKSKLQQ
ncbi:glyoxylate/succinic semialdehyde reductase 2, chloroplastic-like isoform X2 [Momordica charantia]|uniref:Glyoxylate/succinic semialdehyde reductase 2, chloroplastic-like isoform X2 n=1 Tax=Momordica charantia TaxID=3673 RepID=A0A6J1DFF5_MOMCH|nr:glyoxylate/succinic semialdehyde reductase 2, chloroplastic-like isoform X2 [Momordica charantia]